MNKKLLPLLALVCAASATAVEFVPKPYVGGVKTSEPSKPVWTLDARDVNYFNALQRWGKIANYQVRWDAPKHFLIDAAGSFEGSFEEAVTSVLSNPGIQNSMLPLEVCFYPNTPPLARITRKGEQEKECN